MDEETKREGRGIEDDKVILVKPYEVSTTTLSRSLMADFILFPLFSLFYSSFLFSFSIFRTAWVRVDGSRCHISHKLMAKSQD